MNIFSNRRSSKDVEATGSSFAWDADRFVKGHTANGVRGRMKGSCGTANDSCNVMNEERCSMNDERTLTLDECTEQGAPGVR